MCKNMHPPSFIRMLITVKTAIEISFIRASFHLNSSVIHVTIDMFSLNLFLYMIQNFIPLFVCEPRYIDSFVYCSVFKFRMASVILLFPISHLLNSRCQNFNIVEILMLWASHRRLYVIFAILAVKMMKLCCLKGLTLQSMDKAVIKSKRMLIVFMLFTIPCPLASHRHATLIWFLLMWWSLLQICYD